MNQENELTLKQKLNMETAKLHWKDLQLFFAKGNLLRVEPSEDLLTVAEYIASNNQTQIEQLIAESKIAFATPEWVKNNCKTDTLLWTVVVAPYVLCQQT